jgi:Rad3-related DNA helicase
MATRKFYSFRFSGIDVEFPHETPYPAQKGVISNSLQAFLKFDNALLESPTGTGKSLALLAGALAYQKHIGTHPILPPLKRDPYQPHPEEMLIPSTSFISASQFLEAPYKCNVTVKRHNVPVWYTSRTHGQLRQLVGELRKLPYFPQMTILAARKRICLFDPVRLSRDPDTACLKSKTCPYERHRSIPDDFRPRGRHGKFDLEDLVAFCQARMICPYFLTRELMRVADLVFCPYSYIMNPKVKGQMMLSILGVVLIVDEAHNVEAQIRETTSFSHCRCDLLLCVGALNRLAESQKDTELATHLLLVRDMFSGYLRFFHSITTRMRERGTLEFVARDNLDYLAALGVTRETWAQVRTSLDHVFVAVNGGINRETKAKVKIPMYVSGPLEQLYVVIALSVKNNFRFIDAFRFVVQLGPAEDEDEFIALCMTPGAYFSTIADEVNSVVLASGTLAPIHQLAGELGTLIYLGFLCPFCPFGFSFFSFLFVSFRTECPLNSFAHHNSHLLKMNQNATQHNLIQVQFNTAEQRETGRKRVGQNQKRHNTTRQGATKQNVEQNNRTKPNTRRHKIQNDKTASNRDPTKQNKTKQDGTQRTKTGQKRVYSRRIENRKPPHKRTKQSQSKYSMKEQKKTRCAAT